MPERKSSALLTERLWPKTEECVTFNKIFWGRGIDCRGVNPYQFVTIFNPILLTYIYIIREFLEELGIYQKATNTLSKMGEHHDSIIHKGMKALTRRARWQF